MTLKAQSIKEQTNKLNFIKIKNTCPLEETIKRMKRKAAHWEKIFANHLSVKGLVSNMNKRFSKLNNKKIINPVKKQVKYLNRHRSTKQKRHEKFFQHKSLGKCKLKPQQLICTYLLELRKQKPCSYCTLTRIWRTWRPYTHPWV